MVWIALGAIVAVVALLVFRRFADAGAPGSGFVVAFDDSAISRRAPDGTVRTIRWDDLAAIDVRTTVNGPWTADVFWEFRGAGESGKIVFPSGATGEPKLFRRLIALPGFRIEEFIASMSSTEDAVFHCYEHEPPQPEWTEQQLIRKLVLEGHLSVPQRKSLPAGAARASVLRSEIAAILREEGQVPPSLREAEPFDGAILERLRDGKLRLLRKAEVSLSHYEVVRDEEFSSLAEAVDAFLRAQWPHDIDGVVIDWES